VESQLLKKIEELQSQLNRMQQVGVTKTEQTTVTSESNAGAAAGFETSGQLSKDAGTVCTKQNGSHLSSLR
jgi:hypothetical protein